jgi:hypothetical protein
MRPFFSAILGTAVNRQLSTFNFVTLSFILLLCSFASAQDITLSKDSIRVYNKSEGSFTDLVTFTSHSSSPVHLDSAYVRFAEIDTPGFSQIMSHNLLEVFWKSSVSAWEAFYWTMDSLGQGLYRLKEKAFDPSPAEPLVFSGNGSTAEIQGLEIGLWLFGETAPKYPKYINGTMTLFFSNGQAVELKLWSQDLRTAVRPRLSSRALSQSKGNSLTSSRSFRYLANGRRIVAPLNPRIRKPETVRLFVPRNQ